MRYPIQPSILLLSIAAALFLSKPALAQEKSARDSTNPSKEVPKQSQAELEAKFKSTLTAATMAGRWCGIKDGALGPEKSDKYTIVGVDKLDGDTWVIKARIQYNKVDIVAPIPIKVRWAGDTPVIIVDSIPIPGGGTYSARVLVYDNTYAGTWTGGDHGGLINGIITHEKDSKPAEAVK